VSVHPATTAKIVSPVLDRSSPNSEHSFPLTPRIKYVLAVPEMGVVRVTWPSFWFGHARPAAMLKNLEWSYLWNGSSDPLRIWCTAGTGFSGLADRMALLSVGANPKWRPAGMLKKSNGHISAMVRSLDPLHVWFHRIGLIISAARKDRAFKVYTDLGTEEHNKICTQDVP